MNSLIIAALLMMSTPVSIPTEEAVAGIYTALESTTPEQAQEAMKEVIFKPSEIEVLYRIVEAEVTGGSFNAKKNVASVILNRVHSSEFPDTISEVIFQKGQFAPVSNGRYWTVEVTDETREAVDEVLRDGPTTDALYFCNLKRTSRKMRRWFQGKLVYLFSDSAGHSFYK